LWSRARRGPSLLAPFDSTHKAPKPGGTGLWKQLLER
jgi:hypothetical protein